MPIMAVPDKNGVIRVACGGSEIEVLVVRPITSGTDQTASPPGGSIQAEPDGSIFDKPTLALRDALTASLTGGGLPIFRAPTFGMAGVAGGTDQLMRDLKAQFEASDRPNPRGVLFDVAGGADLHKVEALRDRVGRDWPDLPIALNFDVVPGGVDG